MLTGRWWIVLGCLLAAMVLAMFAARGILFAGSHHTGLTLLTLLAVPVFFSSARTALHLAGLGLGTVAMPTLAVVGYYQVLPSLAAIVLIGASAFIIVEAALLAPLRTAVGAQWLRGIHVPQWVTRLRTLLARSAATRLFLGATARFYSMRQLSLKYDGEESFACQVGWRRARMAVKRAEDNAVSFCELRLGGHSVELRRTIAGPDGDPIGPWEVETFQEAKALRDAMVSFLEEARAVKSAGRRKEIVRAARRTQQVVVLLASPCLGMGLAGWRAQFHTLEGFASFLVPMLLAGIAISATVLWWWYGLDIRLRRRSMWVRFADTTTHTLCYGDVQEMEVLPPGMVQGWPCPALVFADSDGDKYLVLREDAEVLAEKIRRRIAGGK